MDEIIRAEPFHIQAYKHIQRNLLEKEFVPGEKLTETALATKLGISRGPIREAIRMLIHDGLLIQKGAHVYAYNPTFKDVLDIYLCRDRLEPLGARLAAEHITAAAKNDLIRIVDETASALHNRETNSKIATLNATFHERIIQASDNNQLIRFMELIRAKNSYMRNVLLGDFARKGVFIEEHREIADAIIEGEKEKAELSMRRHIQKDLAAWEKLLKKSREEDDSK
ncbi:GntR family transcriptional regulator [Virgibacillus sp. NKC19-3]|uniref:GntR family transcriptional regulator n=1 Tax=Virgibacillus saliphilus TaxID=2831674 RepID=UPI001C9BA67F|nr:GntR family transcriptional regulator [Virgibacillus sp. NKC19-3]MBY7144307.1 GntR family transcriptional regulator [Virgibacillus sp. NKC19-3]